MSAYRSAYQHIVGARLAEARLARELAEPVMPQLRSIRSARMARALAGGVGIAGALTVIGVAATDDGGSATYALVGAGAVAIGTYVFTRVALAIVNLFGRAPAVALPQLTGELDKDLQEIDASRPAQAFNRRLSKLEAWSTALPLVAISLLAPLLLHWLLLGPTTAATDRDFAKWIKLSMVIVGHAHLALAALAVAFARKMQRLDLRELAAMSIHGEWARAWGITTAVAAMPGIVLLFLPPVLTALTGLAFIPLMFLLMRRRVVAERTTMAHAEAVTTIRTSAGEEPVTSAIEEEDAWAELAASAEQVAVGTRA